ncbi:MAG: DUF3224 domain-containing protein [Longimicrobiales bacterium]
MKAQGTFKVKLVPQADAGFEAALGRMTLDKVFEGELEGTSLGQMLAIQGNVAGSAGYVALERVTGSVHGKKGSFHLQHSGTMTRGEPTLSVTVVPDSGTGELAGLTGSMRIDPSTHAYEFDYELAEATGELAET